MDAVAVFWVVLAALSGLSLAKKRGRIVGGRLAEKGEFPYMVALSFRPNTVSCGGTILSRWHVLTACHCVTITKNKRTRPFLVMRNHGNARVIAGSLSCDLADDQGYQLRWVYKWWHHPQCKYQRYTGELLFDIAVIKLTQPFILNFFVQPIDLPSNLTIWRNLVNQMQFQTASCLTMGWGFTVVSYVPGGKEKLSKPSKYLKALDVSLTYVLQCIEFFCALSFRDFDLCVENFMTQFLAGTLDRICADAQRTRNGSVCSGDSGSPLICGDVLTDLAGLFCSCYFDKPFWDELPSFFTFPSFGLIGSVPEVKFYVVSRGEALHYEKVKGSLGGTRGFSQVNDSPPIPTVVLLHGLGSSYDSECNVKIAEGLIERKGMNILAIEYASAVEGPGYDSATKNTDAIGRIVGEFLLSSQRDGSISLATTTLIGFSLGAHVAGVAGYKIGENSGYLGRIIGLDPARPTFIDLPLESRLDKSDAGYVMVIHTAAGFLGMEEAIGDADFYPNGGREIQPRCLGNSLHSLVCSHTAACDYLAESIVRPTFIAEKCSSWEEYENQRCRTHEKAFMGFDTDIKSRGTYFLKAGLKTSTGTLDGEAFEVVDVNTLSETDEDRIFSKYHWYPRSSASPFFSSTILFSICAVALRFCL